MRPVLHVKLENFEGPFDLLLELARARRVDVTAMSLREITDDFLQYVRSGECTPELLGDFLVVAATLLLVKVRHLLPRLTPDEEQEVSGLTERLSAYQPLRMAADELRAQWGRHVLWSGAGRAGGGLALTVHDVGRLPAALEGLITALPRPIAVRAHLRPRGKSLNEWLQLFRERVSTLERLVFQRAVSGQTRQDVAISFLAVLELARTQQVRLQQDSFDQDLIIQRV